jgi:hypothetical protein
MLRFIQEITPFFKFFTVDQKLELPPILDKPAKCKLKINRSGPKPLCPIVLKGGYIVQPVPIPPKTILDKIKIKKEPGKIHKLHLLRRG